MEVSLRWFGHEQRRDRKYIGGWNWQAEGLEEAQRGLIELDEENMKLKR